MYSTKGSNQKQGICTNPAHVTLISSPQKLNLYGLEHLKLIYFEDHSPLQRLHRYKFPVVLLIACFNPSLFRFAVIPLSIKGIPSLKHSKNQKFASCWNGSTPVNTRISPYHTDDLAPGQAESHLFSPGRSPKGAFQRKSRSIDTRKLVKNDDKMDHMQQFFDDK